MSWIFGPTSACAQATAESTSDSPSPSAGEFAPAVMSSGTLLRRPLSWPGWKKRPWIRLLSGTTSHPSTRPNVSTFLVQDSRANHSRPRLADAALPPTSGHTSGESSVRPCPNSWFLRTSSELPSNKRGKILPGSGTRSPSIPSTPPSWVPRLHDGDGGFLPTITTRMNQSSPSMQKWPAYRRLALLGRVGLPFWEYTMGLPIGWTDPDSLVTAWPHWLAHMQSYISRAK